jgi:glycosyltransferase involved in cell wall biosynthesis
LAIAPQENFQFRRHSAFVFFYPAYPRIFKNIEQVLHATRLLEQRGISGFEIWLTIDGSEQKTVAPGLRSDFADLNSVRWLGILPRAEVLRRYSEADCLLFPSKLESWGMPITEFKATGKPILAADLPYAHETVGAYGKAAFFDTENVEALAELMQKAIIGEPVFQSTVQQPIAPPFSNSWDELWKFLLHEIPIA